MTDKHAASNTDKTPFWYRHPKWQHLIIFCAVWVLVFCVPLFVMSSLYDSTSSETRWLIIFLIWLGISPYLVVAVINEFILLPYIYNRHKIILYLVAIGIVIYGFTICQNDISTFRHEQFSILTQNKSSFSYPLHDRALRDTMFPNLSIIRRICIAILIIGWGYGYNVTSRYRRKLRIAEELEHDRVKRELTSLRAQISPHFFMNMLNNIHSVMETDTKRAQGMLLEMSQMMHYVTYDTTLEKVPLNREINFVKSYLGLMSARFPADRVSISASLPENEEISRCYVPPMIYIIFIENAFKHGVTYRRHTDIVINLQINSKDRLHFTCTNTLPLKDTS